MRFLLATTLVATALIVSACSPSAEPAPSQSYQSNGTGRAIQHDTPGTARVSIPATGTTSVPPPPVDKVLKPWRPGQLQYGIQLYWHTGGSNDFVSRTAGTLLNYVVGLGANSVAISFPIYTDGATPSHVYAGASSPTPAQLKLVAQAAKARGLRVTLRPLIDEANIVAENPNAWRGTIRPTNVAAWFASYDRLIDAYMRPSKGLATEFVAGTELVSLQRQNAQWITLQAQLRRLGYRGYISYAFNWDNWGTPPFKTLGVDAYPAINLPDSASISQLAKALEQWFDLRPAKLRRSVTAQEVGIPAERGMYPHPWRWGTTGQLDPDIQANWFTAACRAVKVSGLAGLYFWMLDSNTNLAAPQPSTEPSGMYIGRPAERSIRQCFG